MSSLSTGEQRRKREAIDSLITDIIKGSDESLVNSIRIALEVRSNVAFQMTLL